MFLDEMIIILDFSWLIGMRWSIFIDHLLCIRDGARYSRYSHKQDTFYLHEICNLMGRTLNKVRFNEG